MPRWLARLLYAARGRRRVRIHCVMPGMSNGMLVAKEQTIEGVLLGRWGGHYVLELPRLLTSAESSVSLEGMVEIPVERAFFVEVLARSSRL